MIKIEVQSADVLTKTGVSSKTNKPYSIREQEAWAYLFNRNGQPDPYPSKIRLRLDDGQLPYPKGFYMLHQSSFVVDEYGTMGLGRINIVPHQPAQTNSAPSSAVRAA
jgi:hypothetical protein